eukprot:785509-Pleurochrysis_carterae.AAC.1
MENGLCMARIWTSIYIAGKNHHIIKDMLLLKKLGMHVPIDELEQWRIAHGVHRMHHSTLLKKALRDANSAPGGQRFQH